MITRNKISAKAGIQFLMVPCLRRDGTWIPACAGMTNKETFQSTKMLQYLSFSNSYKIFIILFIKLRDIVFQALKYYI